MNRTFALQTVLCFVLLLLVVVYAGRTLRQSGPWNLDLGGREPGTLAPNTRALIANPALKVDFTYFATPAAQMPSHLKGVEAQVRRTLKALAQTAPQRFSYRVLYPQLGGQADSSYAARRKAAPVRVRRILQDATSQEEIWSALALSIAGRPERLIPFVDAQSAPFLEELIAAHIRAQLSPPKPVFAVAAPPDYQLLLDYLRQHGSVLQLDLSDDEPIPANVDLLFWLEPEKASPRHIRQLQHFVAGGGSAILAGAHYRMLCQVEQQQTRFAPLPMPPAWEQLATGFGLRPLAELLMDRNSGAVEVFTAADQLQPVEAPFYLRCLPTFRAMKDFVEPALGGINFTAASALEIDPQAVAQAGFTAKIVATTTAWATALSPPSAPFQLKELGPGLPVGKQNLMVLLKSSDPWWGRLLFMASASPLRDGIFNQSGYGHTVLLRNLIRTLAGPEQLVRHRVQRHQAAPLPAMTPTTRLLWRIAIIALLPGLILLVGVWRYLAGGGQWPRPVWKKQTALAWGTALLALVGVAALAQLGTIVYADLSADQRNTPSPLTAAALNDKATGLKAELFAHPRAALPPALKGIEPQVRRLLGNLELTVHRPQTLSAQKLQELAAEGLHPIEIERVVRDTLVVQRVWNGLRLERQGRVTAIPRLDGRTADHLEFLLVAALERLEKGRAPRVALVADFPRLSPAEALEDFHKKGLSPPSGADVYGRVTSLLTDYGYEVIYVNPAEPQWPDPVDVVLWMQPRRDAGKAIEALSAHLAKGGKAIVALQHFNIQQRQYRGSGFQTVYWPQPQFQDLDRYLKHFGVEQVREVLMDRTSHHLSLETQVNRSAVREYDAQQVALPFLIRTIGAHYDANTPISRNLGDMLFIWGNRFAMDPKALAAFGLKTKVLVTTSEQSWAYNWQGGWLPEASLAPKTYLPGRQPLAILLEGRFPQVEQRQTEEGRTELAQIGQSTAAGALLLTGSSEMFKDHHLYQGQFAHAQYLLNAVAHMTYGPQLATLQGRVRPAPGFAFQTPQTKLFWRGLVVSAGTLILLAVGAWRYGRRHRPLEWT